MQSTSEFRTLAETCAEEIAALFEHLAMVEAGRAALHAARQDLAAATFTLAACAAAAGE